MSAHDDDDDDKHISLQARLFEHLHNPVKLRTLMTGLMLMVGYGAVYMPLNGSIETTTRQLQKERSRLALGDEVDQLRTEFAKFKGRLPKVRDHNEWLNYINIGIRKFPVEVRKVDQEDQRDLGPYKVVVFKMDVEGTFRNLDALLSWLENNPRLIRIDSVKISPPRNPTGQLVMNLVILGVMG